MTDNRINLTQQEIEAVQERTRGAVESIEISETVVEGLCSYAEANGCTPEEARELVEQKVIPTVDEYNAECRKHFEDESGEWILDKLAERTKDMSLEEECKYKLCILIAVRSLSKQILEQVSMQTPEEMEATYEALSDEEIEELENGKYTEEMLEQINEQLVDAVENSGLDLAMANQMESLIDNSVDPESVHGYVTDMWKDEQYKYAAAVAACVAKKNGELSSVPEETSDIALIVGVCQGVDAANVETKVSAGEMAVDKAYKILRTIATVGVVVLAAGGMFMLGLVSAGFAMGAVLKVLGGGLIASIIALALGGALLFTIGDDFVGSMKTVAAVFHKVSDFAYDKLKKGVKCVCNFVKERVVPKVKSMIGCVTEHIHNMFSRIRQSVTKRKARVQNA